MVLIYQKNTNDKKIPFLMVDSTDLKTPEPGVSVSVNIRKPGGNFFASSGSINEIGSGWYEFTPTLTDVNTEGFVILEATGAGCNPYRTLIQVVGNNPYSQSLIGPGGVEVEVVIRTTAATPISNAEVWITTDSSGVNIVAGTLHTDAFGKAIFMLDAGTYYMWVQKPGYNFTLPQTLVVT